jgi:membrane fusion protein, macrolide-specific efflux system
MARSARSHVFAAPLLAALLAALLALLLAGGCFLLPEEQKPLAPPQLFDEAQEVRYETIEVKRSDLVSEAKLHGRLTAARKADLFFRYQGGRITAMNVKVNDRVSSGQVVAELNVGNLAIEIEKRKLLLEKARLTQEMLEATKATRYQVSIASIDVRLAELELESLERSYSNLRLVTPLSGTVVWVNAEEGEYVEAFKPVVRVVDPTKLLLECAADTESASAFSRGASVEVTVAGKDRRGTVIMTPRDALEQTRLGAGGPDVMPAMDTIENIRSSEKEFILIEIQDLPRDAVLNDLCVATLVLERRSKAITLPKDTINEYSGRSYVNLLKGDDIEERDVVVGIQVGNEVEILKGLSGGELVVRR